MAQRLKANFGKTFADDQPETETCTCTWTGLLHRPIVMLHLRLLVALSLQTSLWQSKPKHQACSTYELADQRCSAIAFFTGAGASNMQ